MFIADPIVSLTDYGLAAECAVLSVLATRTSGDGWLARFVATFFAAVGLAALLGGTVHGFLTDPAASARVVAWRSTISLLSFVGYLEIVIGIRLIANIRAAKTVLLVLTIVLVPYLIFVWRGHDDFLIAIIAYSSGLVVLAIASLRLLRKANGAVWLLAGIVLSFVASLIQQDIPHTGWPLSIRNGVYHSIEALALALTFIGFKKFIQRSVQTQ